jgi:hypothetical protein
MTGEPCNFCNKPIGFTDYESIPAHTVCVSEQSRKAEKAQPIVDDSDARSRTYAKACRRCGKSDDSSPRRVLARGGLMAVCNACSADRYRESVAKKKREAAARENA